MSCIPYVQKRIRGRELARMSIFVSRKMIALNTHEHWLIVYKLPLPFQKSSKQKANNGKRSLSQVKILYDTANFLKIHSPEHTQKIANN